MNCKMCGENIDEDWWKKDVEWDERENDGSHIYFCRWVPERGRAFCSRCFHRLWWSLGLAEDGTYRGVHTDEDFAIAVAKEIQRASARIKKYGFYGRCEAQVHGDRCSYDASKEIDGRRVCGRHFTAMKLGRDVLFVGEESPRDSVLGQMARKLLTMEYPGGGTWLEV